MKDVRSIRLLGAQMKGPEALGLAVGEVVFFTRPKPDRDAGNQDALLILPLVDRLVLAVADGAGSAA